MKNDSLYNTNKRWENSSWCADTIIIWQLSQYEGWQVGEQRKNSTRKPYMVGWQVGRQQKNQQDYDRKRLLIEEQPFLLDEGMDMKKYDEKSALPVILQAAKDYEAKTVRSTVFALKALQTLHGSPIFHIRPYSGLCPQRQREKNAHNIGMASGQRSKPLHPA